MIRQIYLNQNRHFASLRISNSAQITDKLSRHCAHNWAFYYLENKLALNWTFTTNYPQFYL